MAALFKLVWTGKKQNFSEPLRVRIVLSDHTVNQLDEDCLTTDCATAMELDAEVDFMKRQLDKMVSSAYKKFPAKK